MTRHDTSESVEIPDGETVPFSQIQSRRNYCDCSESNEIILQHFIKHKRLYYRALNVCGITSLVLFFLSFGGFFIYIIIYVYQKRESDWSHGIP
jgi:hypothetical protein